MAIEIKVPALGESVSEATVAKWMKQAGEIVAKDEAICELETDKVTLEVNAPEAGALTEIKAPEGSNVEIGQVLAMLEPGAAGASAPKPAPAPKPASAPQPAAKPAPAAAAPLSPAVRKIVAENAIDPAAVAGTGKDGRLTKGDVLAYAESKPSVAAPAARSGMTMRAPQAVSAAAPAPHVAPAASTEAHPREQRVRMTRLRKRIAERLKSAQNTAAMLTTFNEVDMSAILKLREQFKDGFEKKHGVRLGFMGFFVKACVQALQEIPAVNGEIDGDDIIYKNHYDIGVAVGTEQGLVVPVVRDCDELSIAGVEKKIGEFGKKARDGKLGLDDLQGGTFTISNGGVYGSLMSTPILNPPQSGILGMHKIQPRPMAIGDKVEVRPMMYLALSYDHRIVDGKEAVTFLVRVKENLEDPQRFILEL